MTARLMIFWDYDTQWGADRSRTGGGPKKWGHLEFPNTDEILDIFDEYEARCCFAVVGSAALPGSRPYHDPGQIRQIHARGHEVGSHSFKHEWLPALGHRDLLDTLRASKDTLEQCIGAPVVSFVPPFNAPFDFGSAWAWSFSERRAVRSDRTDVSRLCDSLRETGFQFCRLAYRPLLWKVAESVMRRRIHNRGRLFSVNGIQCVRLNCPLGFDGPAQTALRRCVAERGLLVAYAHPHSLQTGGPQDKQHLRQFLKLATDLQRAGSLEIACPSDLVSRPITYLQQRTVA